MTCLIVDDNDLSRLTLHQLALQTGSLQVPGECKDTMEAHRNITAKPPDLFFLDIEMPGMSGIELAKKIRTADILWIEAMGDYIKIHTPINFISYIQP